MKSEGWYDHHLGSGLLSYHALSEECKSKSKLIVGPWDHWFDVPVQGHIGRNYDNNDLIRSFKWFYDLQIGKKETETGVSTYVIGGDYWIDRPDYNVENQEYREFPFQVESGIDVLSPQKTIPGNQNVLSYSYDPENPVPS